MCSNNVECPHHLFFTGIKSIKHTEELPALDDIYNEMLDNAEQYLAEELMIDSIAELLNKQNGTRYENAVEDTHEISGDHDGDGTQYHFLDSDTIKWYYVYEDGNYYTETKILEKIEAESSTTTSTSGTVYTEEELLHDHDGDGVPDH